MKTALVFGHTSGLGFAITQELLEKNYFIIGFARSKCNVNSKKLLNIQVDLSKKEEVEKIILLIRKKYSAFDCIIYCSGRLTAHSMDNLSYKEMEQVYKVNVFSPIILESGLLSLIKKNNADVVNITSSALIEYYPMFAEYSSGKAALQKFTRDLQKELKETKCRVVEFCPGAFTSNIYKNMTGERVNRNEAAQVSPHEYTKVLMYLLELPKNIVVPYIYIDKK